MRLGAAGDIVMTTPLLTALRNAYPNGHFTWILTDKHCAVMDANPYIDEIILWDISWWGNKPLRLPRQIVSGIAFARQMRARHFDVFLNFDNNPWPLLVRAVNAPLRIGVFNKFFKEKISEREKLERFYNVVYTKSDFPAHRTDQALLPLNALHIAPPAQNEKQMIMGFTARDDAAAQAFLEKSGIKGNAPFVVIAPITTWPSKCWPLERFAALADRLVREQKIPVVLIGSPDEKEAVNEVMCQMREKAVNAGGGVMTLRQIAALLRRARLLVSNDTGPMHIASAVKTSTLSLFGPTPIEMLAPLFGPSKILMHPVPCGPCDLMVFPNAEPDFMKCMRLITVNEAFSDCAKILSDNGFVA